MSSLASALATITTTSYDNFMNFFGKCFVRYFSNFGYDRTQTFKKQTNHWTPQFFSSYDVSIRATGRYFTEFLQNVDNIHSQFRLSYPKMKSPSMYVTQVDENGCVLVYRSGRHGFTHYLMGKWLTAFNKSRLKIGDVTKLKIRLGMIANSIDVNKCVSEWKQGNFKKSRYDQEHNNYEIFENIYYVKITQLHLLKLLLHICTGCSLFAFWSLVSAQTHHPKTWCLTSADCFRSSRPNSKRNLQFEFKNHRHRKRNISGGR